MTFRRLTIARTSDAAALSRRDFLTCRVSEGRRILELSCESLYMRYQDACSGAGRHQVSNHDEPVRPDGPVTGLDTPEPAVLFAALDRELAVADELRVLERVWLGRGELGREVGARIEAFRQRGGRVELGSMPTTATATATGVSES
jgi:hypothetical protein